MTSSASDGTPHLFHNELRHPVTAADGYQGVTERSFRNKISTFLDIPPLRNVRGRRHEREARAGENAQEPDSRSDLRLERSQGKPEVDLPRALHDMGDRSLYLYASRHASATRRDQVVHSAYLTEQRRVDP